MNTDDVIALMAALKHHGLQSVEVRDGERAVTIRAGQGAAENTNFGNSAGRTASESDRFNAPPSAPPEHTEVTSPLGGTLMLAPQRGATPFAAVGARVAPGSVLCALEHAGQVHEIESEVGGTVAEVLAAEGQRVEPGSALFTIATGDHA